MKVYQEEDSTFASNGNVYDLNIIFKLTHDARVYTKMVSELQWQLKGKNGSIAPPDDRVHKADYSVPILIYFDVDYDKFVVVDGYHRLYKAWMNQERSIKTKIVTHEIMQKALINKKDMNLKGIK